MQKQNMVLCAADEEYITKLAAYYANLDNFPFLLWYFTDVFRLRDFMDKHEISVLLLGEEFRNLLEQLEYKRQEDMICFYLTKEQEKENKASSDIFLYQFQSACLLWEKMIRGQEKIQMIIKEQDSVARGQLVGFFSVMCEERKTGLAMGFAQLLAKKHRVLYLNFDGCAGIGCEGEYEYGLSDLFYFFLQSKERMLMKLSSVKKNMNGLDWIPPCRTYQDISQITGEQWKEFISALLESRQYEYLILDCSSQMQSVLDILEMCGKVVVPYYPVSGCIRKHEQFEQMLFCSHKEILMRRIQWIRWKQHIVLPTYPEELLYSDLEPYIREIQLEE